MLSRRNFVSGLAMAGALIPVHGLTKESSKKKMPICIFSKHLQWCNYKEMADLAGEIGFDGVDLTVRPKGHVLPEEVRQEMALLVIRGKHLSRLAMKCDPLGRLLGPFAEKVPITFPRV